ncbi:MAG: hypothetical protein ACK5NY_01390 [Burkholderiaceae bacterium]
MQNYSLFNRFTSNFSFGTIRPRTEEIDSEEKRLSESEFQGMSWKNLEAAREDFINRKWHKAGFEDLNSKIDDLRKAIRVAHENIENIQKTPLSDIPSGLSPSDLYAKSFSQIVASIVDYKMMAQYPAIQNLNTPRLGSAVRDTTYLKTSIDIFSKNPNLTSAQKDELTLALLSGLGEAQEAVREFMDLNSDDNKQQNSLCPQIKLEEWPFVRQGDPTKLQPLFSFLEKSALDILDNLAGRHHKDKETKISSLVSEFGLETPKLIFSEKPARVRNFKWVRFLEKWLTNDRPRHIRERVAKLFLINPHGTLQNAVATQGSANMATKFLSLMKTPFVIDPSQIEKDVSSKNPSLELCNYCVNPLEIDIMTREGITVKKSQYGRIFSSDVLEQKSTSRQMVDSLVGFMTPRDTDLKSRQVKKLAEAALTIDQQGIDKLTKFGRDKESPGPFLTSSLMKLLKIEASHDTYPEDWLSQAYQKISADDFSLLREFLKGAKPESDEWRTYRILRAVLGLAFVVAKSKDAESSLSFFAGHFLDKRDAISELSTSLVELSADNNYQEHFKHLMSRVETTDNISTLDTILRESNALAKAKTKLLSDSLKNINSNHVKNILTEEISETEKNKNHLKEKILEKPRLNITEPPTITPRGLASLNETQELRQIASDHQLKKKLIYRLTRFYKTWIEPDKNRPRHLREKAFNILLSNPFSINANKDVPGYMANLLKNPWVSKTDVCAEIKENTKPRLSMSSLNWFANPEPLPVRENNSGDLKSLSLADRLFSEDECLSTPGTANIEQNIDYFFCPDKNIPTTLTNIRKSVFSFTPGLLTKLADSTGQINQTVGEDFITNTLEVLGIKQDQENIRENWLQQAFEKLSKNDFALMRNLAKDAFTESTNPSETSGQPAQIAYSLAKIVLEVSLRAVRSDLHESTRKGCQKINALLLAAPQSKQECVYSANKRAYERLCAAKVDKTLEKLQSDLESKKIVLTELRERYLRKTLDISSLKSKSPENHLHLTELLVDANKLQTDIVNLQIKCDLVLDNLAYEQPPFNLLTENDYKTFIKKQKNSFSDSFLKNVSDIIDATWRKLYSFKHCVNFNEYNKFCSWMGKDAENIENLIELAKNLLELPDILSLKDIAPNRQEYFIRLKSSLENVTGSRSEGNASSLEERISAERKFKQDLLALDQKEFKRYIDAAAINVAFPIETPEASRKYKGSAIAESYEALLRELLPDDEFKQKFERITELMRPNYEREDKIHSFILSDGKRYITYRLYDQTWVSLDSETKVETRLDRFDDFKRSLGNQITSKVLIPAKARKSINKEPEGVPSASTESTTKRSRFNFGFQRTSKTRRATPSVWLPGFSGFSSGRTARRKHDLGMETKRFADAANKPQDTSLPAEEAHTFGFTPRKTEVVNAPYNILEMTRTPGLTVENAQVVALGDLHGSCYKLFEILLESGMIEMSPESIEKLQNLAKDIINNVDYKVFYAENSEYLKAPDKSKREQDYKKSIQEIIDKVAEKQTQIERLNLELKSDSSNESLTDQIKTLEKDIFDTLVVETLDDLEKELENKQEEIDALNKIQKPKSLENLEKFSGELLKLVKNITWTGGERKLILIGDISHDRGLLDNITFAILDKITEGDSKRVVRIAANHDHDVLSLLLKEKQAPKVAGDQACSSRFSKFLAEEQGTLDDLVKSYEKHLTDSSLIHYDQDTKTCYAHAPLVKENFKKLYDQMKKASSQKKLPGFEYDPQYNIDTLDADTFPDFVKNANLFYSAYIKHSFNKRILDRDIEDMLKGRGRLEDGFIWKRDTDIKKLENKEKDAVKRMTAKDSNSEENLEFRKRLGILTFVHGHDSRNKYFKNDFNLEKNGTPPNDLPPPDALRNVNLDNKARHERETPTKPIPADKIPLCPVYLSGKVM